MFRRVISGITLTLLLTRMLTFNIQPIKAEYVTLDVIYIRANGSIEPSNAPINTTDYITYTLTDDILSRGVVVERSGIIIDGQNYMVRGFGITGSKGILLNATNNVTIINVQIENFVWGIYLDSSLNNTIARNNMTGNIFGIHLQHSSNNNITENTISNEPTFALDGIYLSNSSHNNINGNYITHGKYAVHLENSSSNVIYGNTFVDCGLFVYDSYDNTVMDNLVNNKPLIYFEGVSSVTIDNAGQVVLVNCNYIQVENILGIILGMELWRTNNTIIAGNNLTNSKYGVRLYWSLNNTIQGNNINAKNNYGIYLSESLLNKISENNITHSWFGIYLERSPYNSVVQNNITANSGDGIRLDSSSNNSIIGNYVTANLWKGICVCSSDGNDIAENNVIGNNLGISLTDSSYNSIVKNNMTDNDIGLDLYKCSHHNVVENIITSNSHGLFFFESKNNSVYGNKIMENNDEGVHLGFSQFNSIVQNIMISNGYGIYIRGSDGNSIVENEIANNNYGIYVDASSGNKIFHNNFINNTQQACAMGINYWDNHYPSGGNFWSDYAYVDEKSGQYQNETGSDGIGDLPYNVSTPSGNILSGPNVDNYPLIAPITTFNAGTWNEKVHTVSIISNSTLSDFRIDITGKTLMFNVSGENGENGFCRITIPKIIVEAMWQGNYIVLLSGEPLPFKNWTDATNTYIYINYTHSTHQITIIPEFPSTIILLTFMPFSTIAITFTKRRKPKSKH